jgi:hypothetical protein
MRLINLHPTNRALSAKAAPEYSGAAICIPKHACRPGDDRGYSTYPFIFFMSIPLVEGGGR